MKREGGGRICLVWGGAAWRATVMWAMLPKMVTRVKMVTLYQVSVGVPSCGCSESFGFLLSRMSREKGVPCSAESPNSVVPAESCADEFGG